MLFRLSSSHEMQLSKYLNLSTSLHVSFSKRSFAFRLVRSYSRILLFESDLDLLESSLESTLLSVDAESAAVLT